ncbi:unnamed protein product [marine sediment metagenome]|uniref:Uncharacterized protein n=1 Tax=marine sediment metagenome TaxID=412755 RepID=X1GRU4_9ZZZZ
MAKVKSPMLSIEASGVLGKSIINQTRKKIKYIKVYSKPKNPQTKLQQDNRNYIKLAVIEWRKEEYKEIDKQAWNFYAKTKNKNMSGYNALVGFYVVAMKNEELWTSLTNCNITDITSSGCKVHINVEEDKEGILYLGNSKFSMRKEYIGVFSDGKYLFTITGLEANIRYYFYIKNTLET